MRKHSEDSSNEFMGSPLQLPLLPDDNYWKTLVQKVHESFALAGTGIDDQTLMQICRQAYIEYQIRHDGVRNHYIGEEVYNAWFLSRIYDMIYHTPPL